MPDTNEMLELAKEATKEIAKEVYQDGGRPVVKPTGELVGLVPRAIKAALAPLEQWVLQKEYNVAETKRLLEEKLKNVPPEQIQPPEAHIAVPAMQYISYCMDNDELRDMYANLLANSMNEVIKNGVHPGFVEIIKQLCPDEAKILKAFRTKKMCPTITLRYEDEKGQGMDIIKEFSIIGEQMLCEHPFDTRKYFDNLVRLGLLERPALVSLTNKVLYEPLKEHSYILAKMNGPFPTLEGKTYNKVKCKESFISLTAFGESFCESCLAPIETITFEMRQVDLR
jgi:hypothetical protein